MPHRAPSRPPSPGLCQGARRTTGSGAALSPASPAKVTESTPGTGLRASLSRPVTVGLAAPRRAQGVSCAICSRRPAPPSLSARLSHCRATSSQPRAMESARQFGRGVAALRGEGGPALAANEQTFRCCSNPPPRVLLVQAHLVGFLLVEGDRRPALRRANRGVEYSTAWACDTGRSPRSNTIPSQRFMGTSESTPGTEAYPSTSKARASGGGSRDGRPQ